MNLIKNGALLLLIILIAGLILCSFLGGNCNKEGFTLSDNIVQLNSGVTIDASSNPMDPSSNSMTSNVIPSGGMYDNYDHYSGTSGPLIYYGPNGGSAKFTQNSDGTYTITVLSGIGQTTTYTTNVPSTTSSNTTSSSTSSSSGTTSTTNPNFASSISSIMSQISNQTFYGPNGGSARLFTASNGQYAIEETQPNGNTTIYTAANTYTYNYNNQQSNSGSTSNPGTGTTGYGYSAYPYSDFSAGYSTGNTVAGTSNQYNNQYYNNSLPPGIPYQMIPPGQEDLYILKSEVVPPVCPACPTSTACPRKEKCPPCPACARCPEPSFECKKVPNYNAINNEYLPTPVLSDFSSFGM